MIPRYLAIVCLLLAVASMTTTGDLPATEPEGAPCAMGAEPEPAIAWGRWRVDSTGRR